MKVLDLFSGIGGISLGLERAGTTTVAFCEIEPFPRAVLAKHWPSVPCFEDIRSLDAETLDLLGIDRPDIIAGGFPCQDISVAGKGKGVEHGERSGLWREMYRLIHEIRPRWVLAENVPALRTRGADRVISDLEAAGYTVWPVVVGAWAVGAPHKRDRVWIVAHRHGMREQQPGGSISAIWGRIEHSGEELDDANERGLSGQSADATSIEDCDRSNNGLSESPSAMVNTAGIRSRTQSDDGRQPDGPGDEGAAHAEQMRRGSRPGVKGNEESTGCRGSESSRGGCRVGQADSCGARRQERHSAAEPTEPGHGAGCAYAWPARPGEPQHEWEAPRLEWPVGLAVNGISERLVRFANRNTLKAGGNSVVPQVVEMIGRAIVRAEGLL